MTIILDPNRIGHNFDPLPLTNEEYVGSYSWSVGGVFQASCRLKVNFYAASFSS
ncbi:hypothetical protein AAKU67_002896 [Oxalobacteraceae bacterium GrIS 2.11]